MSIHLTLDIYIYLLSNARSLCGKQRSKQLYLLCTSKYWRISYINQQRSFHISRTRYKWTRSHTFVSSKHSCNPRNHDLHIGVSKLSTSAPKGLTKVSIHMSRIKNTLDSVSKAVFGNQNEMFSRFSRFKPGILRKKSEDDVLKQKSVKQASGTNTLNDSSDNKTEKGPFPEGEISDPSLENPAKIDPVLEKGLEERKQNIYYTNYIIAKFEESLYFLSNHINSYFTNMTERTENDHLQQATEMKMGKDEAGIRESPSKDEVQLKEKGTDSQFLSPTVAHSEELTGTSDTLPVSVKQSFANFLARPSDSVQALVGGYIVGLVPKLKADAKYHSEEFQGGKAEQASGKENHEEEKKHLSLQREKIIERVSIDNRTRALVRALRRTTDHKLCINRIEELTFHLLAFPEARALAVKEKLVPYLLRLRRNKDEILQATVRENLALIGYTDPVKGRGIRILTIDGGGIRGVVALQSLRKIVELTKKPIHQLFDYICGVSTGAILAFMVGLFHMDLDDCEELYRKLGTDVFTQNLIIGTVKMGWKHEFYDSETWERILKDRLGSNLMIETARNPKCPKVAAVSTVVNRGIQPKAFVFRNYDLFPGSKSHYLGGCHHKVWQAIRASSAAPGYFAEYTLGKDLHQDGGLLLNNPTALAMHECKCLWPDTPLQCIVSLGTGRYEGDVRNYSMTATSLRSKLSTVISSATDTEEVHIMLDDFLPPDTYFRINPVMRENIPLDESRNEKLDFLQSESIKYLERNEEKIKKLTKILTQEKTALQKINDWLKLKSDMYEGFPFLSKL
ncbi:calcium-independent phospholipase A2-gamma isoform X2 [Monodelphis domestica]|uniref:Patatin like phospholipase domain containing 8 n=1 Tax=Monodelphis domestica TaxID=13616 RepID=F7EG41_MONDO|nr:calcium-independent phospholipase A2-gamma isoform X2 [Monodelphis domestica]XP_056655527.1 calcium-independent phospholipase A2-gamma isoform X2 [Monodelphis domestica]